MAFNPTRSWAVTYNQMWNLSMHDAIPRNMYNRSNPTAQYVSGAHSGNGQQKSGKRKSSDYCCNFNKGVPCKFGSKCKFIERCKYCDLPSHGVNTCIKLLKKTEGGGNGNGSSNSSNNKQ